MSKRMVCLVAGALLVTGLMSRPLSAATVTGDADRSRAEEAASPRLPDCDLRPFLSLLADPLYSLLDGHATASYHLAGMNAVNALSLGGLGDVAGLTNAAIGVHSRMDPSAEADLQAEAAREFLAALLGDPAAVEAGLSPEVWAALQADALLAAGLGIDTGDVSTDAAVNGDVSLGGTVEASGGTAGGGGGGMAALAGSKFASLLYGPNKSWQAGAPGDFTPDTTSRRHVSHSVRPKVETAANTASPTLNAAPAAAVPLPSGAVGGIILIGALATAHRVRRLATR